MTNDKEVLLKAVEIILDEKYDIANIQKFIYALAGPDIGSLWETLSIAEECIRIKRDMDARLREYRNK